MTGGYQAPKGGYVPLNGDHDLPNNACQAPAAVKIGITLLFSECFSPAGATLFSNPASQRSVAGE